MRLNSANRPRSPANSVAIRKYSCGSLPISSGSPTFDKILIPPRPTPVRPRSVTIGTPIHIASQLVIPPAYGNGSSAISIRSCKTMYSSQLPPPNSSIRSGSIPMPANRASNFCRCDPGATLISNFDFGTAASNRPHNSKAGRETFAKLFRLPNVTNPARAAGSSFTAGVAPPGL